MDNNFTVKQIGAIRADENGFRIENIPAYKDALIGLEGFSYLNILWWFSGCDNEADRSVLSEEKPYKKGPNTLGAFATRSPQRPNPIALSCAYVTYIDAENGVIGLAYICYGGRIAMCQNKIQCINDGFEITIKAVVFHIL